MCCIAVDISRLTVKLLSEELKNVNDWYVFGVALGIPVSELDNIKVEKPNDKVESWKISMYCVWLRANADASWNQVIQALEKTSNFDLAARVKMKYLLTKDRNEEGISHVGLTCMLGRANYTYTVDREIFVC